MASIKIHNKDISKADYSLDGNNWTNIPINSTTTDINVSGYIKIKSGSTDPFTIGYDMSGSSTNVAFTLEYLDGNIWQLSDFTGTQLHVTLKN